MDDSSGGYNFKQIAEWNEEDVARWMAGLGDAVSEHVSQFLAHCICGEDLLKLNRQRLEYLKVTQVGHQELFLEAVELLSRLDANKQSYVTLGAVLSKKSSQLLRHLSDGADCSVNAVHLETSAAMMSAAKALISSLDRNPTPIIDDYNNFRKLILMNSLQITAALSEAAEYDAKQLTELVMTIVKATSVLISPDVLGDCQPVELNKIILIPDDTYGLGISMEKTGHGLLLVTNIQAGSPADVNGKVHIGDEVIQVNEQNVIGWEMSHVIECLKASEFQVCLILKPAATDVDNVIKENSTHPPPPRLSNGSVTTSEHSTTQPEDYINPLSIHDAAEYQDGLDSRATNSPLSDTSSHSMDGERSMHAKVMKGLSKNFFIPPPPKESYEDFIHRSDTESGQATPDSGMVQSAAVSTENMSDWSDTVDRRQQLSDVDMEHDYVEPPEEFVPVTKDLSDEKKSSQKPKMPSISYKTQIVGGVVHRIPITSGACIDGEPSLGQETSPKISRGSLRNKKKPTQKPKQSGGGLLGTKFTKRHAKQ